MVLYLVTGPPCAGKSTHVQEHRARDSVVVDLDAIARAFGYPDSHVAWGDPHPAIAAARTARTAVIAAAQKRQLGGDVWVIDADPHPTSLRIFQRLGARLVNLDPGRDECRRRAVDSGRSEVTRERIDQWYAARPGTRAGANVKSAALGVFGAG